MEAINKEGGRGSLEAGIIQALGELSGSATADGRERIVYVREIIEKMGIRFRDDKERQSISQSIGWKLRALGLQTIHRKQGNAVRVPGSEKLLGLGQRRPAKDSDERMSLGGRSMDRGIRSEIMEGLLKRVTWGDIKPFIESTLNGVAHPNDAKEILEFLSSYKGEMPLGSFVFDILMMRQLELVLAKIAFEERDGALGQISDLKDENLSMARGYFRAKRAEELKLVRDAR